MWWEQSDGMQFGQEGEHFSYNLVAILNTKNNNIFGKIHFKNKLTTLAVDHKFALVFMQELSP